ncbi:MAG: hypothetical protein GPJ51_02705 [Candidatus Heimdallarchaeota archaeon]|nr:hypothetical protein [Candidatus Heimdallarchaeota archaeon]
MTGQVADSFLYEGEIYSLIGIDGDEPFSPLNYDILPVSPHTACWRGFVLYYKLSDGKLLLQDMQLSAEEYKEINGITPKKTDDSFNFHYQDLDLYLEFTGKLLIAKDFIQDMYIHMGFQRPSAYETVFEIIFDNGMIVSENDLSKLFKKRRKKNRSKGAHPKSMEEDDLQEWIKGTFSLDYDSTEED